MNILTVFGMLILCNTAVGHQHNTFMAKYKDKIQKYIMTGHEEGWKHCDILSANPSDEGVPQLSMNLETINTLNIKSAFENTHCLLMHYDVSNKASFLTLLEFGWNAINHVRLALMLEMHSGITLEMIENTSKLPFLVAAQYEDGREQFICPVIGELNPLLVNEMCNQSYLDYKNKTLRIGLIGIPPDFVMTDAGTIDGANIRMIDMIAKRFEFSPQINVAVSYSAAEEQVISAYRQFIIKA